MWEVAIRILQKSAPGSGFNCRATFVTLNIHSDECDAAFYYAFFLLLTIVHTSRVCHNNKISDEDCKTPSVKQRRCHEQTWIFASKERFHWGMYNEVVSTLRCHYTSFSHTLKLDQGIIFLIFLFRCQRIWRMLKIFFDWLMKRLPSNLHFLNMSSAVWFPTPKRFYGCSSPELKGPSTSRQILLVSEPEHRNFESRSLQWRAFV